MYIWYFLLFIFIILRKCSIMWELGKTMAKSLISELYISADIVDCLMVKMDYMPNDCLLHKFGVSPEIAHQNINVHHCVPSGFSWCFICLDFLRFYYFEWNKKMRKTKLLFDLLKFIWKMHFKICITPLQKPWELPSTAEGMWLVYTRFTEGIVWVCKAPKFVSLNFKLWFCKN